MGDMPKHGFLPSNHKDLLQWIRELVEKIYCSSDPKEQEKIELAKSNDVFLPPVEELRQLILHDPRVNMWFHQMFDQLPRRFKKDLDIKNYRQLLRAMNFVLTLPPVYTEHHVGCPINGILTYPMGTVAGYAAFLDNDVNVRIENILVHWKKFLQSPDSRDNLTTEEPYGWFQPEGLEKMKVNGVPFQDLYVCDPGQDYWGFKSWDDFFIRQFQDGQRPVSERDKDPRVVVNACESAPYRLRENVKRRDKFWVKDQLYSIEFMLASDPLAEEFVGGTVYQGFLSNMTYHRWHSPVDGKVVKAYIVPGAYYSEARSMGWDDEGDNRSQAYLTEVQVRALVFIECENPYIGLMCFVAVGMGDVSSCEITCYEGQKLKKGDQTGTFHIGGSTHCLLFRKGVKLDFDFRGQEPSLDATNINLSELIAVAKE